MSNWLEDAIKNKLITSFEYYSFQDWEEIGKGGFGAVYSAHSSNIEKTVALKRLYYNKDDNSLDNFIKEIKRMNSVAYHDNIARFFGVTQDPKTRGYYMVLQFANNGDLRSYLRVHFSELDWTTKIRMAKEISSGVNCLHGENIVHCDLHDGNILVHHGTLMITDFGLSKSLDNYTKSIAGGTCSFSDPQYIKNPFLYERNKSSDIYSLGVLFWELSSGVPPFKDMDNQTKIAKHVINGGREPPINGTPIDFMNIYRDAWNGDPNSRPKIEEIRDRLDNMRMTPVYHSDTTSDLERARLAEEERARKALEERERLERAEEQRARNLEAERAWKAERKREEEKEERERLDYALKYRLTRNFSNNILKKISEIFNNYIGGMDATSTKEQLITFFKENCPKDRYNRMKEFVKEYFEDFVSEVIDEICEKEKNLNYNSLSFDFNKKTKIVMNLWDLDKNDGINNKKILTMKEIMNEVVDELQ